ncbi:hypothetical protein [Anaeromyxobacter terrae]|uniref:hypothetical protein n=1 Tax=Anaeromyxobacter terrae TaxID=2925406 RepID=UPI001F5A626B|nr:hypothetical protein [Anaeromyxobacter sp. SG22]
MTAPPGPDSADALARTFLAEPVTTTWKASNSFRAAAIRATDVARAGSPGRIFSVASATQIFEPGAARDAAGSRARASSALDARARG